jgi:GNAT superfamily N-acetyltransferase
MEATTNVTIRAIDVKALSAEERVDLNAIQNAMRAESHPEDPPTPVEELEARFANMPSFVRVWAWLGRDEKGQVVCWARSLSLDTGDNPHLARVDMGVLPEWRRQGFGRRLLREVVEAAQGAGKTLLMGDTTERVPAGAVFCEWIGARPGLDAHMNRLVLADVDRAMVQRWVQEGPTRAPGYELVGFDGQCPAELEEQVVAVLDVMNTQPRGDLEANDLHFSVEQFREMERFKEAQGNEAWWLFARHLDSGTLVGLTDVWWNSTQPDTVWQGNTGVHPDHRGHALGKWLKAAMLERILVERPKAVDLRTGNADSNDAMLGINHALGFRPFIANTTWQVEVERVAERLASSGVTPVQ